ncbi:MAG: two-component system cell cycle sensor histidine kinase/response regulator CckA [Gammaproteobacteria bacterium]|jgi:two-component system cell cycle sensor histidine kinase/response regulator CckA
MSLYRDQELIGMCLTELEAPLMKKDDNPHISCLPILQGEHVETQHRRKDGSIYTVETSTQTLLLRDVCLAVFILDIEERKNAERKLVASQRKYYDVVEGTTDLITRVDTQGIITFVNHASSKIYGLPPEECIGRNPFLFVHTNDRELTQKEFARWLQSDVDCFSFENRQVSLDGQEFQMDWSVRTEYDGNNTASGFLSMARDTTESRLLEIEQSKLENQLQQAQKMEAVGQLAGGVAHDFYNMLGVIIGHADLVLAKLGPAGSLTPNVEKILKAANHCSELTKQLLTFARKQTIKPKVVNLNDSVTNVLTMLRQLIGENITLVFHPNPELRSVEVDPSQVDQIIANLCVNARDSISGTRTITLSLTNDQNLSHGAKKAFDYPLGQYVQLSVEDDGMGIDSSILPRIFEPFFTTKELGDGTGLGLATVFGAVKQKKGFIDIHSEPKRGTIFEIYIPRSASDPVQLLENNEKKLHQGTETILLVEDDEMLLDMETAMLKRRGYNILSAGTRVLAQKIAEEYSGRIHLLLTDVIMPEMNGKELSEKLLAVRPEMDVLFMWGYPADIIASKNIINGKINFLQKPFSMQLLTGKVRDALDRKTFPLSG